MNLAYQQAFEKLDLSKITANHVIIIRCAASAYSHAEIEPLRKKLPDGALIVWMSPWDGIESFSEIQMNKQGWFTTQQLVEAVTVTGEVEKLLAGTGWGNEKIANAMAPQSSDEITEVATAKRGPGRPRKKPEAV